MLKNPIRLSATLLGMALVAFTSCEDQDFTDVNNDATRVEVNTISAEMAKVRDYVPDYAVMAHRGSTFCAPSIMKRAPIVKFKFSLLLLTLTTGLLSKS
jgi:glycerophosphoryl diester phosphodiesterase